MQWRGDSGPVPFQNMTMEKLTTSGHVLLATISPDGKYVVNAVDERTMGSRACGCGMCPPAATRRSWRPRNRYSGLTFSPNGDFLYFVRVEPQHPGVGFLYTRFRCSGARHAS